MILSIKKDCEAVIKRHNERKEVNKKANAEIFKKWIIEKKGFYKSLFSFYL